MPCFSTFVEDSASQPLAEDKKNCLCGMLIEKSLPTKDLKSKDITYSVFSKKKKQLTNVKREENLGREQTTADRSKEKGSMCISHLSPMKI